MAEQGSITNHAAFIWSVADLLRGDYKQSEYGRVILPLVVMMTATVALFLTGPAIALVVAVDQLRPAFA